MKTRVLLIGVLCATSISSFAQFYENFDTKTKSQLTAVGWGYYPTSGISLLSNSGAYSGKSLFTNAGGGNWEIVATPCMLDLNANDTLDFYFTFITTTGTFNIGWQKYNDPVPTNVTWLDTVYATPWVKISIPFHPPTYFFRFIFNMNCPGNSNDKFGVDEILVKHATNMGDCSLLPVELAAFSATPQMAAENSHNFNIDLSWETQSELNSDYFEVLRSSDGNGYESVAKIDAAGHSTLPLEYSYTDQVSTAPFYYYQLKMVDFNGSYHLSEVQKVDLPTAVNWYFSNGILYYLGEENTRVEVSSIMGSITYHLPVSAHSTLDISKFTPGIYLISVGNEGFKKIWID